MTKWIALLLALALSPSARAQAVTPADSLASSVWGALSASQNFHLFDNAGAGYYLDVVKGRHQSLGGLNTALYEPAKYHTSLDANVVAYQVAGGATKSFVFPSVSFHFGELTGIQKLESKYLQGAGTAQLNVGVWGARDWIAGEYRAGIYSNLSYFWGN